MSCAYSGPRSAFLVAERDGQILGGAGFAPLEGGPGDVCELRKMYLLESARGLGLGRQLLERCLNLAREHAYEACYLESLSHMQRALKLYRGYGFVDLDSPMGSRAHSGCNTWMFLKL